MKLLKLFSCIISLKILTYIFNLLYINRFQIDKSKKSRYNVAFNKSKCENCSLLENCLVVKYYYLRFNFKDLKISRRFFENPDDCIDIYQWRPGVDATMSEYDRKARVKQLRVLGLSRVKFVAVFQGCWDQYI